MSDRMKRQSKRSQGDGTESLSSPLKKLRDKSRKGSLSWGDASPQKVNELLMRIVDNGGLVSFSKTSDQGALVLYVKDGIDEEKSYAASEEELDIILDALIEAYAVA